MCIGVVESHITAELVDAYDYAIDDDDACCISCYDGVIEQIRFSFDGCINFNIGILNYSTTIEEMIFVFCNSIQYYYEYTQFDECIYPGS